MAQHLQFIHLEEHKRALVQVVIKGTHLAGFIYILVVGVELQVILHDLILLQFLGVGLQASLEVFVAQDCYLHKLNRPR